MNADIEPWRVAKPAVASADGVVAAQHGLAARAGAAMLERGGNAVDAAISCAFTLAAVEPWMCGLGGSGYLVVLPTGARTAQVVDFQGVLPAAIASADYPLDPSVPDAVMGFPGVRDNRNVEGYASITVPGAVKGLARGLDRFGRLGLDTVLGPAIALADRGLAMTWFGTLMIALGMSQLRRDPAASALYLPNGIPAPPETLVSLGNLGATLRAIADGGPGVVHGGAIGEAMVADLRAGGSRITLDDLESYEVLEHPSLDGVHRGATVHTAGPTSGGPRLIEALQHVESSLDPTAGVGAHTYKTYADALDLAWRSHRRRLGLDPAAAVGSGCTSHLSAVDAEGTMVALTYTLLNRFGSGVLLPKTGILMNNAVSYFDPRPGRPTSIASGKRINASNMCPTIVSREGRALFALGASGANHIMPSVMQITALMLDHDLDLEAAFHVPRIDASDRGSIRVDPALGEQVIAELSRDFSLEVAQALVFPKLYGCPSGVARDPVSGICQGLSDPNHPHGAAAPPAPFVLPDAPGPAAVRV